MANNSIENWQPNERSDAPLQRSGPSGNEGWANAAREGQSAAKLEPTATLPAAFPHSDYVFSVPGSANAPGSQPTETSADAWLSRLEAGAMPGGVDNFAPPNDRYNSVLNGLMSYEHESEDPWVARSSEHECGTGGELPSWGTGSGGAGGDTGGGTGVGGTGTGTGGGSDMSSVIQAGPGVSSQEVQQAIADLNALPASIQQALLASGAQIQLASGWQPGLPQGENDGTTGLVYADSGMMNQALIHEASEMAGQTATNVPGLWDDPKAVQLADQALNALGPNAAAQIGDLNDTVGSVQGDGDLISNVIAALVTADNPTVGADSVGQSVEQQSVAAAPQLTQYIAQALGIPDPFSNNETV